MNVSSETLGGLSCRVVDRLPAGWRPRLVAVLCHGFGAPALDLVPLAHEFMALDPRIERGVRFIFPAAPIGLDDLGMHGGRAWWHIDIARLNASIQRGEFRNLRNDVPRGLAESRQMLATLLDEVRQTEGIKTGQIVLGGFSQGAMLATDAALRLDAAPAALCIFSGTLICEDEWRALARMRGPLTVLQSHGYEDPILPFEAAGWLCEMLRESGIDVEFIPFHGYHTIPMEAVERFAALLGGIVSR
jgi:phospholipase/carboxylesterase